ncbi:putative transporter-like protein [Hapsidospora chrysogenum ATCC 11550]|uniref:Putative transporter-like protein n=1 Tax=Hapsidospora chrysogenum (strain ATCC 11550 / CBS 779.69 / DSM 880 / IAM 14645 / JCM 23072 / IMI 49137) TaxID=857340 RepID=A0A086TH58_HAPC1|nr:putative transporter-like protein [Hapsidospora chrysogenum ATCC 11550]
MDSLARILSRPLNKPYRTRDLNLSEAPHLDTSGHISFPPSDIENPKNWTTLRRWQITACTILLVINATFASSAPSGCIRSISSHFAVSEVAAGLTVTLFLLGYVAGPLVFAPLSEFYGRRWVFYVTFSLYLAFNFLCAFAPNFGALLVGRFLTGTFVSAPLSNGPGVLADLWNPLERGNAMASFSAFVYIGPALGPVISGFMELEKDWRWSFYVILWLGAISAALMLTIPETYAPVLLLRKARRLRAAGYSDVRAAVEDDDRTLVGVYKVALTRPWIILFDPISFLCAVYMSVVYTLVYMLFVIYPIVFQQRRGWNAGVGALPLLGTAIGAMFGAFMVVYDTRRRRMKIESGHAQMEDMEPEDRLPLAMVGGVGFPLTMFWFAWSAEYDKVHWIVPTLAGALLSTSLLLIFVAYTNYIVDTYLTYAASAVAANTIARSACGAAAPLFTQQMFDALGVGPGGSLIGGCATLLAVIPFMFWKYGKVIRKRSRFAAVDEKKVKREQDVERSAPDMAVQVPTELDMPSVARSRSSSLA